MIKKILIILFFGFSVRGQGQELHHQMLSGQGDCKLLPSGVTVWQTIGQQSISGNYKKNNLVVGQGYQQSTYTRVNLRNMPYTISTTTYPNPVSDYVSFKFSSVIDGFIKVIIFDLLGKVVFYQEKKAYQNVLTIDNIYLSEGTYLVQLTAPKYNYSTKILKLK